MSTLRHHVAALAVAAASLIGGALCTATVATTTGCTPGDRAIAGTVLTDVSQGAPLPCVFVTGSGASVCGSVASAVSDVARLVAGILASLPPAAKAMGSALPSALTYHGCVITLPPGVDARAVRAALP